MRDCTVSLHVSGTNLRNLFETHLPADHEWPSAVAAAGGLRAERTLEGADHVVPYHDGDGAEGGAGFNRHILVRLFLRLLGKINIVPILKHKLCYVSSP